jgi:GT2 family glycosyltransferase
MTATVIIPVTGTPECAEAIDSVLNQTYPTTCYVVCDGDKFKPKVQTIISERLGNKNLKTCYLPINVGANGFYGHRTYAAFTHLVDTKYVMYLDQDCWLDKNHVETCVKTIEEQQLDWCYSLRKIYTKEGEYICNDDCESLGRWQSYHNINHIDTNSYCIKTEVAIKLASAWHGGWGQDRVFLQTIAQHFQKWHCTGEYTSNYRVDGGEGSVNGEFFLNGNQLMKQRYGENFPWKK